MKQEKVIEIARLAGSFIELAEPKDIDWLTRVANEIERRTLERAAVVCETGVDTEHPTVKGHIMKNFGKSTVLATAIRALKDLK